MRRTLPTLPTSRDVSIKVARRSANRRGWLYVIPRRSMIELLSIEINAKAALSVWLLGIRVNKTFARISLIIPQNNIHHIYFISFIFIFFIFFFLRCCLGEHPAAMQHGDNGLERPSGQLSLVIWSVFISLLSLASSNYWRCFHILSRPTQ